MKWRFDQQTSMEHDDLRNRVKNHVFTEEQEEWPVQENDRVQLHIFNCEFVHFCSQHDN